ncbi:hypothetical protein AAMO2058_000158100 [Amorphochlora amoebiformis]
MDFLCEMDAYDYTVSTSLPSSPPTSDNLTPKREKDKISIKSLKQARSLSDIAWYLSGNSTKSGGEEGWLKVETKGERQGIVSRGNKALSGDVEVINTRYGVGRVLARRWDGVTELHLKYGTAYIHEFQPQDFGYNQVLCHRSTHIQTLYGPGEVLGGGANGILKIRLSFATAYLPQHLAKFDVAPSKQEKDLTCSKKTAGVYRGSGSPRPLSTPVAAAAQGNKRKGNGQRGRMIPRKKREVRVRSLLNTLIVPKDVSTPTTKLTHQIKNVPLHHRMEVKAKERKSDSLASHMAEDGKNLVGRDSGGSFSGGRSPENGEDSLNAITKALTGESIFGAIDAFLKQADDVSDQKVKSKAKEAGENLLRSVEKALATDDAYRSLTETVSHVGTLVQTLGVSVDAFQKNGVAALDQVENVVDGFINNVNSEGTVEATEAILTKSQTLLESPSISTASKFPGILGVKEEGKYSDPLGEKSEGLGRCEDWGEESENLNLESGNFVTASPHWEAKSADGPQGSPMKKKIETGNEVIGNGNEGRKKVIQEMLGSLKSNLKVQHRIIQRTARKVLESKALNSINVLLNDKEFEKKTREITSKGISALTGVKMGDNSQSLERISESKIKELHSELLGIASDILGFSPTSSPAINDENPDIPVSNRPPGENPTEIPGANGSSEVIVDPSSVESPGNTVNPGSPIMEEVREEKVKRNARVSERQIASRLEGAGVCGGQKKPEGVCGEQKKPEGEEGRTVTLENVEELRCQMFNMIKSKYGEWGPGIRKAISVLSDKEKYFRWIQTWTKVARDSKDKNESITLAVFMSGLSTLCVDFLKSYLPTLHFEPFEGLSEQKDVWYRISRLSLKGLQLNEEAVHSELVGRQVTIRVWDISCDIKDLGWEFRQCRFPYVTGKGSADAKLTGGSFTLCLRIEDGEEDTPLFTLREKYLSVENLAITVTAGGTWMSWFANTVAWLFGHIIKQYIVYNINWALDSQIDPFVVSVILP